MLLPCPRERATRQERLLFDAAIHLKREPSTALSRLEAADAPAPPKAARVRDAVASVCPPVRSQPLAHLFMHAWLVAFLERGEMTGEDPRA